jgi:hypothetical protein
MRGCRIILFTWLLWPQGAIAQMQPTLRALLLEYRCPVVDRLERIYSHGNPSSDADRFLAITHPGHPHGYVQCMFFDNRRRLLCEASSGFYFTPRGHPRTFHLQPDAIAALGRLGFSTDGSQGNFRLERELGDKPDFNALADLVLTALHDGYGARADSRLRANAPFAKGPSPACIPVS